MVVQLVRMPACHAGGREFESRPDRKREAKCFPFFIMRNFVYILQSLKDNTLYKGYTTDIEHRLDEHNSEKSRYTKNKTPLKLIYLEEFVDKNKCFKKEKIFLKSQLKIS